MKLAKLLLTLLIVALPSYAMTAEYTMLRPIVYPVMVHENSGARNTTVVSSGSAVMIDRGYALTAAHVVPPTAQEVMYLVSGRQSYIATPIKIDRDRDIALLAVQLPCPCAVISTHLPPLDDPLVAIGYPMYLNYQLEFVTLGNLQGWYEGNIVSTANTAPGGSGGGLFWKDGKNYRLVGITVAIATSPIGPHMLGIEQERTWIMFSVPSSTIVTFLNGTPVVH